MNFNFFRWRSLKTRVSLFTLGIFLISFWSLAFYASWTLRNDMQRLLSDQQFSTASFIAAEVDEEMEERLQTLEKVAGRISPAMLDPPATVQTFLEEILILEGLFNAGVFVTRIDGVAIADIPVGAGRIGVDYRDRDYLIDALKGKATISRPVMGKMVRAPIIAMATPIRDAQGVVIGALAGVTNLGQPNFLDRITDNRYGQTGGYLLIAPQHRLIVTASDKSRVMEMLPAPGVNPGIDRFLEGYEGSVVIPDPRGVEVLASDKGIPAAGWIAAVTLPTTEAFAPIRALQQHMVMATVLLSLLAGGLTWWMLRRQLSPMLAAVKTLSAWSEVDQPPQPLPVTAQGEIGKLISSFNRLLATLAQREQALKQSEERFRSVMENITNIAVQGYALDGTVIFWNRASELLYGYSATEAMGGNLLNLIIPSEMRKEVTGAIQQMVKTGETIPSGELLLKKKDGSSVLVFSNHALIKPMGLQPELFCLDIDLTALKQAEQYEQFRSRILELLAGDQPLVCLKSAKV